MLLLVVLAGCGDTAESFPNAEASNLMPDVDKPWRSDPALTGKFHPDYPDDIQVIVHEGGPRLSEKQPEIVWVRVTGQRSKAYQGTLLNQPRQLPSLRQNESILFMVANSGNDAFLVTEKYLLERGDWHIGPCSECGLPELFDAPSDLQAAVFEGVPADAEMEVFTSLCPVCGGVQIVSSSPIEDSR